MEVTEIEEMRKDPVKFVEVCFPEYEIMDYQREMLRTMFGKNIKGVILWPKGPTMNSVRAIWKSYKEFKDGYKSQGLRKTQKERVREIKTQAEKTFDQTLNRIMRGVQTRDIGTDY